MSLEERIIKRWQEWYRTTDTCFEPYEPIMKELVNLALEEVQRGMVEPRFTTQEAVAVEHALSMLDDTLAKSISISNAEKIVLLRSVISPEVLSALGKIQGRLNDIKQAQEKDLPGVSGTRKNCPICKRPIPKKRKYCSIRCSNRAQSQKSVEVRQTTRLEKRCSDAE
jgi:hypothetical protein